MASKPKHLTPPVAKVHPATRAEELTQIVNDAFDRYSGTFDELEKAIGLLMLGDYVGWKAGRVSSVGNDLANRRVE
jgi:hypothetical protein